MLICPSPVIMALVAYTFVISHVLWLYWIIMTAINLNRWLPWVLSSPFKPRPRRLALDWFRVKHACSTLLAITLHCILFVYLTLICGHDLPTIRLHSVLTHRAFYNGFRDYETTRYAGLWEDGCSGFIDRAGWWTSVSPKACEKRATGPPSYYALAHTVAS